MFLSLIRYSTSKDDTLGLLFIDGKFACYTLEDEYREIKVMHETRIPDGVYKIGFMEQDTPKTLQYRKRFDWFHYHLHLKNVPGFTGIYIHIGNDEDDTSGCILVGNTAVSNVSQKGRILNSTITFKPIYLKISEALKRNEVVEISVKTISLK